MSDVHEDRDKHQELRCVPRPRSGQYLPEDPQHRLRNRHRPHRAIEISPFVALSLRGGLYAWKIPECAEHPDAADNGKVGELVHLLQAPVAKHRCVREARHIQGRKRDYFPPSRRIANATVEGIRTILGEPDDIGLRLASRQAPPKCGDRRSAQDYGEPADHAAIESPLEEVECQRPGRDEKNKDPDWPVKNPIVALVSMPNRALRIVFDEPSISENR